jgi:hypothetical protein
MIGKRLGRIPSDVKLARLLPLALLTLTACVSSAPRIYIPDRMKASCENRAVKQTAIESIIASTDDTPLPNAYPGDAALQKTITQLGGVFAYWKSQPLRMPDTAKKVGVDGDYLTLTRAVITNQIDKANHSRPVWFTFEGPKGSVTVLERAYDIQDVCIEGQADI